MITGERQYILIASILDKMNLILQKDFSLYNHSQGIDNKAKHLVQMGKIIPKLKQQKIPVKNILKFIVDAYHIDLNHSRTQRIFNKAICYEEKLGRLVRQLQKEFYKRMKKYHWNDQAFFNTHMGRFVNKFSFCSNITYDIVCKDFNLFNYRSSIDDPDYNNNVNEIKSSYNLLKDYLKHFKTRNNLEKINDCLNNFIKCISNIDLRHNSLQKRYNLVYNDFLKSIKG